MKVTQLCLSLCDPMDYTVHGILQARILEWVAFCFSRGSPQPRSLALPVDSLPAEPQGKLLLTKDEDYLQKEGHWHRGSMRHSIFLTLNLQLQRCLCPTHKESGEFPTTVHLKVGVQEHIQAVEPKEIAEMVPVILDPWLW